MVESGVSVNVSDEKKVLLPDTDNPKEIIRYVYDALEARGHDPVLQFVGYLVSGDPTYITSYGNARSLIKRVERDELLEEIVSKYVKSFKKADKNGK